MEFITEVSDYLQDKNYLTAYEKSVIFGRLQIKTFNSWQECKNWIDETIQELLESAVPEQEINETRKRVL